MSIKKVARIIHIPFDPQFSYMKFMYSIICMYMLWFKFSFGTKVLKKVQFLFSFVVYSLPYSGTMANKIETNSKNFKPRINSNHNIYTKMLRCQLDEYK